MNDNVNTNESGNGLGNGTPKRRKLIVGILGTFLLLGLAWAAYWAIVLRWSEATDDAYVNGDVVQITSQVPGTVVRISANDTDFVQAGTPLVQLDTADARVALDEAESKQLFSRFGIPVTREIVARTPDEAAVAAKTFPGNVVVKVLSRDLLHKSEAGGVAVNVAPADVAAVCAEIAKRFAAAKGGKPDGFLVQELIRGGIELILGFHHDAQLGPVILLGMGGVAAELYRDTTLRLAPVSRGEACAMIDELKTSALLKGYRGRPAADVEALAGAIVAFSDMVMTLGGDLQEAEINPLFVLPRGRGVVAADGVIFVNATEEVAGVSTSEGGSS